MGGQADPVRTIRPGPLQHRPSHGGGIGGRHSGQRRKGAAALRHVRPDRRGLRRHAKPIDELGDVRDLFPLDYDPPDTLPDEETTPEAIRARQQAFKEAAAESRRRAAEQRRAVKAAAPAVAEAAGERRRRRAGVR